MSKDSGHEIVGQKDIPDCLGPRREPEQPKFTLPQGTWDAHFHTLGPVSKFRYAPTRRYSPPDAPLEELLKFHDHIGVERGFVVHANTHGLDNSVFLDTLDRTDGRYRGVLRLNSSLTVKECRELQERGVRGARFAFNPAHGGALDRSEVEAVIRRIAEEGWFVEFHFEGEMLAELSSWFADMPVNVVIDHFGRIRAADGPNQDPFRQLLTLAEYRHVWIKISGADRVSATGCPYDDVTPFTHALAEVAADRLIWGTDWPHTGYFERDNFPSDNGLVDVLPAFLPEPKIRYDVLVNNPLRLAGELGHS